MTEVAEAEALILARMPSWPSIRTATGASRGRVLREVIVAERDQPPFDRVTMDGIAISCADWSGGLRRFESIGTQAAGAPASTLTGPGQCVEIMTGAVCPAGADTIIPVERLRREPGSTIIVDETPIDRGQCIHPRGSDRRQGDRLLEAGIRIGATEIAVIASAGYADVAVAALPRVAMISTGDELVGPGEPLAPYQIRSTNDFSIEASLALAGLAEVTCARLRDDETALTRAVAALHDDHDALIVSGGVSMGQFDFVPAVLERLGAELVFHRVEQRPGRPLLFAISRDAKPIFALPGNPVSALVCLTRYVIPALRHAAGLQADPMERAVLTDSVTRSGRLTYFLPVKLGWDEQGTETAEPRATNTSGDFVSLAGTDGFVELPKGRKHDPKGTVARVFRW